MTVKWFQAGGYWEIMFLKDGVPWAHLSHVEGDWPYDLLTGCPFVYRRFSSLDFAIKALLAVIPASELISFDFPTNP